MGCGASRAAAAAAAAEARYLIEQRDFMEAVNPVLKRIRLANEEVGALWDKVDFNGDGTLETPEIAMILVDIGHPLSRMQIEALMSQIDEDGSGVIGKSEFIEWYKKSLENDWKNLPAPAATTRRTLPLHERIFTQVPIFAAAFSDSAPRHRAFFAELAVYVQARAFAPNEIFIRKGDFGDEMYMIAAGTCDILLSDEPGADPVDTIGPGDITGEGSLYSNQERTAFVRTSTETKVLVLSRAALDAVLPFYPRVRDQMDSFRAGRFDGLQKETVEERRLVAQKRARAADKGYAQAVFMEFYNDLQSRLTGEADPLKAINSSSQAAAEGSGGLDVSLNGPESSTMSSASTPKPRKDSLLHSLKTPDAANRVPPLSRSASPLKQALLTHPKLTPRSEALRQNFESGVAELSSQLLDLSVSVADISASMSAEKSGVSLNASTTSARYPNAGMMEALEQVLMTSKDNLEARMEAKLRRVEKTCYMIHDTFKSTHNEELVGQQAIVEVESWLDERGLGRSNDEIDCTDEIISQLQIAEYHPAEWMPLLDSLTSEQLMTLAEESAWQIRKRKRWQEKERQREERLRLLQSGLLKECSRVAVHGIGKDSGKYRDVNILRRVFEAFGLVKDVRVFWKGPSADDANGAPARHEDESWAVVTFEHPDEAKAALAAFNNGNTPPTLTVEYDDLMTERTRHLTRPQRHWHKLRVMWRVGLMIQTFITGLGGAAATRRRFEQENKEAQLAQEQFQRELEEAEEAKAHADREQAEAHIAAEKAQREAAEMNSAEQELNTSVAELEIAESSGLSIAIIAKLKRKVAMKRKAYEKEKREWEAARRAVDRERAEAQEALQKLNKEEHEMRKARVRFEKEQREAELVMRLRERSLLGGTGRAKPKVREFELPAETAVVQLEANLRSYRSNAQNNAALGTGSTAQGQDSFRAKLLTDTEATANILDGLSQALLRLDPPKVITATLRAAEAEMIRSRLARERDQRSGIHVARAAANLHVTKLGAQGVAQALWRETLGSAADVVAGKFDARNFVDD